MPMGVDTCQYPSGGYGVAGYTSPSLPMGATSAWNNALSLAGAYDTVRAWQSGAPLTSAYTPATDAMGMAGCGQAGAAGYTPYDSLMAGSGLYAPQAMPGYAAGTPYASYPYANYPYAATMPGGMAAAFTPYGYGMGGLPTAGYPGAGMASGYGMAGYLPGLNGSLTSAGYTLPPLGAYDMLGGMGMNTMGMAPFGLGALSAYATPPVWAYDYMGAYPMGGGYATGGHAGHYAGMTGGSTTGGAVHNHGTMTGGAGHSHGGTVTGGATGGHAHGGMDGHGGMAGMPGYAPHGAHSDIRSLGPRTFTDEFMEAHANHFMGAGGTSMFDAHGLPSSAAAFASWLMDPSANTGNVTVNNGRIVATIGVDTPLAGYRYAVDKVLRDNPDIEPGTEEFYNKVGREIQNINDASQIKAGLQQDGISTQGITDTMLHWTGAQIINATGFTEEDSVEVKVHQASEKSEFNDFALRDVNGDGIADSVLVSRGDNGGGDPNNFNNGHNMGANAVIFWDGRDPNAPKTKEEALKIVKMTDDDDKTGVLGTGKQVIDQVVASGSYQGASENGGKDANRTANNNNDDDND